MYCNTILVVGEEERNERYMSEIREKLSQREETLTRNEKTTDRGWSAGRLNDPPTGLHAGYNQATRRY